METTNSQGEIIGATIRHVWIKHGQVRLETKTWLERMDTV